EGGGLHAYAGAEAAHVDGAKAVAEDGDGAGGGVVVAGEQLHHRRLARAVGAEDDPAIVGVHRPGDVLEDGAVALAERDLGDGGGVCVTLPSGESFSAGSSEGDAELSAWLGRDVRLERASEEVKRTYRMQYPDPTDPDEEWHEFPCPPGTYFDAAPVHLLSE